MDKWIITVLVILASLIGEAYLLKTRIDKIASRWEEQLKWEQKVVDRLEFLNSFCCGELYDKKNK